MGKQRNPEGEGYSFRNRQQTISYREDLAFEKLDPRIFRSRLTKEHHSPSPRKPRTHDDRFAHARPEHNTRYPARQRTQPDRYKEESEDDLATSHPYKTRRTRGRPADSGDEPATAAVPSAARGRTLRGSGARVDQLDDASSANPPAAHGRRLRSTGAEIAQDAEARDEPRDGGQDEDDERSEAESEDVRAAGVEEEQARANDGAEGEEGEREAEEGAAGDSAAADEEESDGEDGDEEEDEGDGVSGQERVPGRRRLRSGAPRRRDPVLNDDNSLFTAAARAVGGGLRQRPSNRVSSSSRGGGSRQGGPRRLSDSEDESDSEDDEGGRRYSLRKRQEAHRFSPSRNTLGLAGRRYERDLRRAVRAARGDRSREEEPRGRPRDFFCVSPGGARRRRFGLTSLADAYANVSDDDDFARKQSRSLAKNRERIAYGSSLAPDAPTGDSRYAAYLRRQIPGLPDLMQQRPTGPTMGPKSGPADIDPMTIDRSIGWDDVGGLDEHVRALKEMVILPLLYPEVFDKFKIAPPRGVLFYGPPGTGKTLVARALANSCTSADGKKVSFFMRKGADCLTKWVGEAERQLRLLFDVAYKSQPSIIFFDEIDGLAPVRSSRQDQIHSSIVSTLLALMDGLDSRGQVIVIGATNRVDSLDPALRRPGRFDRELLFPLPSQESRRTILRIHTKGWEPPLPPPLVDAIAERCVGYCGADLKALCTEAALRAVRRRYPQIYHSTEKHVLDLEQVRLVRADFEAAFRAITPASHRSARTCSRPLPEHLAPVLGPVLQSVLRACEELFPPFAALRRRAAPAGAADADPDDDIYAFADEDEEAFGASQGRAPLLGRAGVGSVGFRPRLLIDGPPGAGQAHVAAAALRALEQFPAHAIDLPSLYADLNAKSVEEALVRAVGEARRSAPAILLLSHLDLWWRTAEPALRATLWTLLRDIPPAAPLMVIATCEVPADELPEEAAALFPRSQRLACPAPGDEERRAMFAALLAEVTALKPANDPAARRRQRLSEALPKAPPPAPAELSADQLKEIEAEEEEILRDFRQVLRDFVSRLAYNSKFKMFAQPVDAEDAPDYYEVVKQPMDLSTILDRINKHRYNCIKPFVADMELIFAAARCYNPEDQALGRKITARAYELYETALQGLREVDRDLVRATERIAARRGAEIGRMPSWVDDIPSRGGAESSARASDAGAAPAASRPRRWKRVRDSDEEEGEGEKPAEPEAAAAAPEAALEGTPAPAAAAAAASAAGGESVPSEEPAAAAAEAATEPAPAPAQAAETTAPNRRSSGASSSSAGPSRKRARGGAAAPSPPESVEAPAAPAAASPPPATAAEPAPSPAASPAAAGSSQPEEAAPSARAPSPAAPERDYGEETSALLRAVVDRTRGCCVEELEALYARLQRCAAAFAARGPSADKGSLFEEMMGAVRHFESFPVPPVGPGLE